MNYGLWLFRNKKIIASNRSLKEWKKEVPAWIRIYFFFISGISDMRILMKMHKLIYDYYGCHAAIFIDAALQLLDSLRTPQNEEQIKKLYNENRLFMLWDSHNSMINGYNNFIDAYDEMTLQVYPACEFFRVAGAKTKRPGHVKREGIIQLKTNFAFWESLNNEDDGGFGLPYSPFGFRSWMRSLSVDREKAEELQLIKEKELLCIAPSIREKWGLPILYKKDLNDQERLKVIEDMKKWGVWEIRKKMLAVLPPPQKKKPEPEIKLPQELQVWVDAEMERLMKMTEDEILAELLGTEKQ
ncbi:MAG: hypothetical protein II295_04175 [Akkermansia sp.]|nr:hypothetical protein [Akkermansia sp.]